MSFLTRALAPTLAAAVIGGATVAPASAALLPDPSPAPAPAPARTKPAPDRFNVATFNVLGGSHRAARSGQARMTGALRYLGKHQVSLAGLQELEPKQYAAFRSRTAGSGSTPAARRAAYTSTTASARARSPVKYLSMLDRCAGSSTDLLDSPPATTVVSSRRRSPASMAFLASATSSVAGTPRVPGCTSPLVLQ